MKGIVRNRMIKTRKFTRLLLMVPFVKCIILNGSLAQGKARADSDIDLLIIVKDGHLWTARFCVLLLATLLGQKRSKNGGNHAGKFCINYFLTESYLKIGIAPGREEYCAKNYSHSVLIAGDKIIFENFMKENERLFIKYNAPVSFRPKWRNLSQPQNQQPNSWIPASAGMTESGASWFEKLIKNIQIKKIESDLRTKMYPKHIVYNDREARFHSPKEVSK